MLYIKEYINQPGGEYQMLLGETYDNEMKDMAEFLKVSPGEIIRRGLMLMKHAIHSDSLYAVKNDEWYKVIVG